MSRPKEPCATLTHCCGQSAPARIPGVANVMVVLGLNTGRRWAACKVSLTRSLPEVAQFPGAISEGDGLHIAQASNDAQWFNNCATDRRELPRDDIHTVPVQRTRYTHSTRTGSDRRCGEWHDHEADSSQPGYQLQDRRVPSAEVDAKTQCPFNGAGGPLCRALRTGRGIDLALRVHQHPSCRFVEFQQPHL